MHPEIIIRLAAILLLAGTVLPQPGLEPTLREFIEKRASARSGQSKKFVFNDLCPVDSNVVAARVFSQYGAFFAANGSVSVPNVCIFSAATDVARFHASLKTRVARIDGVEIELQQEAMESLLDAIAQIQELGSRVTPLDGAIAGKRVLADTVRIWNSRFLPALDHWVSRGKISIEDADRTRALPTIEQVERVLDWESRGYFFGTGMKRPIMSSVAPPGTSQHLSLIAFDIQEGSSRTVRDILNRNGWFQTVVGDPPHFTYLGVPESILPERGLRSVLSGGQRYWVPRLVPSSPIRPEAQREQQ